MARTGTAPGANNDANTGLSRAAEAHAAAAAKKVDDAFRTAVRHLKRNLERRGRDQATINLACMQLEELFYERGTDDFTGPNSAADRPKLSTADMSVVKAKFALSVVLGGPSDLPGQKMPWFDEEVKKARIYTSSPQFVAGSKPPVSERPPVTPAKPSPAMLARQALSSANAC